MWLRPLLAVLALVVAAWFGLLAVQSADLNRASALLIPPARLSAAQAAQIRGWLDTAGSLNPDRTVDLLRGRLLAAEGQLAAARRLIGQVTRQEPQNLDAWVAMAVASANDPPEFRRVLRRVRALEPLLPGQRRRAAARRGRR